MSGNDTQEASDLLESILTDPPRAFALLHRPESGGASICFAEHQLDRTRCRTRQPGWPGFEFREGAGRQQDGEEVHPRDAVDHRVVRLGDEGEAIAFEPFHHPDLPERLRGVELLRHDAAAEALQLPLLARPADLYLNCDVDVPWIDDGTRYFPDPEMRARFARRCQAELTGRNLPHLTLTGDWEERFRQAVAAIVDRFPQLAATTGSRSPAPSLPQG